MSLNSAFIFGALMSAFGLFGLFAAAGSDPNMQIYGMIIVVAAVLFVYFLISRWYSTGGGRAGSG